MIRWEQGRAEIDELLRQAQLQRVPANSDLAEHYLALGRDHLVAADMVKYVDTPGAFALNYDAARLALGALLIVQGLRARGEGAHVTVLQAVLAQCEPPRQSESEQCGRCFHRATLRSAPGRVNRCTSFPHLCQTGA